MLLQRTIVRTLCAVLLLTGTAKSALAQERNPTSDQGFWQSAFAFFKQVLDAVSQDPLLAILWGFGILLLIFLVVVLALARTLSAKMQLGIVAFILIIFVSLFTHVMSKIPSRTAPQNMLLYLIFPEPVKDVRRIKDHIQVVSRDERGNPVPSKPEVTVGPMNDLWVRLHGYKEGDVITIVVYPDPTNEQKSWSADIEVPRYHIKLAP